MLLLEGQLYRKVYLCFPPTTTDPCAHHHRWIPNGDVVDGDVLGESVGLAIVQGPGGVRGKRDVANAIAA